MISLLRRSLGSKAIRFTAANYKARATLHCRRWSTVSINGSALSVHALDSSFPFIWLRDSCPSCPTCIHPTTSQKLHTIPNIQPSIAPVQDGGVRVFDDGIQINWTDGHTSFFPESFLRRHSSRENLESFHRIIASAPWDRANISNARNLFLPYESLRTPSGLLAAIHQILQYGLLFITDVPSSETSDARCELPVLAELFGDIRTTFYGRLWDVVSVPNSKNIAYTNLELGLHMDLLYFEHPPRYQILHCLRNKVQGGTSIFVDAFHAASTLRETHPVDFDVLTKTPVAFHYINDGHHLYHEHPAIELVPPLVSERAPQEAVGHMNNARMYINYSPPFQAPLPLSTPPEFYTAFARFMRAANDPLNTYSYTLREGDAVFFDNRRILHGRTGFRANNERTGSDEGEANRWLKGCYLEVDSLVDRGRMLMTRLERGNP